MPNKPKTDYEAVERDYRAGQLSIQEVARKHGISPSAVRKRARANGWDRDLADQVQQRAAAKDQANIAQENQGAKYATKGKEDEIVEASAEAGAEVLRGHRQDLQAARRRTQRLAAALDRVLDGQADDTDFQAVGRDSLVQANDKLVRTTALLIEKERQAFRLDQADNEQGAGQLAEALTKAKRRAGDDDG